MQKRTPKLRKQKRQVDLSPVFSISKTIFRFSLVFLFFTALEAESLVPLADNSSLRITSTIEHWEDKTNKLKFGDILKESTSLPFQKNNRDFFNFGFTTSSHWFRFQVEKMENPKFKTNYLLFRAHNIDLISVYFSQPNGEIKEKRIGHLIPMSEREFPHRNYIVALPEESYGQPIYFRIKSDISLQFAVELLSEESIRKADYTEQWIYGLFFGSLGIILIYNLSIAFFVRDINYIFYLGYVLFFGLGQMSLLGFSAYFLFPESPYLMRSAISLYFSLSLLFFSLFSNSFLKLDKRFPIASRILFVFSIIFVFNAILSLCGQIYLASVLLTWLTVILAILILILIVLGFIRRIRSFYYFGVAFFILMLSSIAYALLKIFTIETNSFFEEMLFPIASVADITLFSFALADRIQLLRLEKDRAVAQIMHHEKESQISRDILMQSLPKVIPRIQGLDVQIFIQPMKQVGGDFYEFYSPNNSELGTLMCDVSGHGIPASLISAMGKIAFATQRENLFSPKRVLEGMNNILYGNCHPHYLTASYVYLNVETNTWRFGRAGHPSSYLQRRNGEIIKIHPKGRIVGAFNNITVEEVTYTALSGDRIIMLTDGVTEAFNKREEMYGETRLIEFIKRGYVLAGNPWSQRLIHELESFSERPLKEWEDDITFILLDLK